MLIANRGSLGYYIASARLQARAKVKALGSIPRAFLYLFFGAEEGIRTLDPILGKEVLYH